MFTTERAKQVKAVWQAVPTTEDPTVVRDAISSEIRSQVLSLLLLGLMVCMSVPVSGVALILAGVATYALSSAAMLPVVGVVTAYVATTMVFSPKVPWKIAGLFYAIAAVQTFRHFLVLRNATDRLGMGLCTRSAERPDRSISALPWVGCALTLLWLGVLGAAVLWDLQSGVGRKPFREASLGEVAALVDALAFLALGCGVAALLVRSACRTVSTLTVVANALSLALGYLVYLTA